MENLKNLAGQNTEKPRQSKNKVKTNARVRVNASKVNDEAVLHTRKVAVMAARRGLLALLSSTSKDYEEVLAYVRSQRMSSKSLRRIVDELRIKHEDNLDEELSVPDLCELLTGHGKRGQSDHPAELSIPWDTNGQNSESEPEGENPGTLTCVTPRDEKMITSLLSTITRLVSITNDLKTELHGLKAKFDNEMALSKDREQRLTNQFYVLEKMLSNHGEIVQKKQRWDQIHQVSGIRYLL